MQILPGEFSFIRKGQIWAITGNADAGNSNFLKRIDGERVQLVSFRHSFRNLSNTTDFYYQQRFNSCDSEDAPTVRDHLAAIVNHYPANHWNIDTTVDKLNLGPLLDEQLIKLSNGETKRVLIAAALISAPLLLLLDHPLTGLDASMRQSFASLLPEIAATGITVLMATSPLEIPASITHVAVMENNKVIHQGSRKDFDSTRFSFSQPVEIPEQLLRSLLSGYPAPAFQTVIGMRAVNIAYDNHAILTNIHWTVRQGEKWALSGPNGAGKSTLLSLVTGDNPQAYANHIVLFDKLRGSGESIWDIKKNIGYVSPELFQYFPMDSSCLHVIESGFYDTVGLFRPSDALKESVCRQWMQLMGIHRHELQPFSRVPAGVQRLCLLARALVKNPPLLILDEPTQGLDLSQQQFFTRLVDMICENSNVTLVYVSHYVQHIPTVVSNHLRLQNGRVVS